MNPLERLLSHQAHDPAHDGHVSRTGTDHQGDGTPSVLARALRSKVAWIVAALLLLAVLGSGVLVVALVLPASPPCSPAATRSGHSWRSYPGSSASSSWTRRRPSSMSSGRCSSSKATLEGAG